MSKPVQPLVERLQDEADLCRNDGADDIAALLDEAVAEIRGLMQTLRDELDENLRLRELGGARPDEGITAMTERIVAENAQLRAELDRLNAAAESEKHAHTDWVDDDVRVRHPRA